MSGSNRSALCRFGPYSWGVRDMSTKHEWIVKGALRIDTKYQRPARDSKVRAIASDWSWPACGEIVVVDQGGDYHVIDGAHRVLAANRRDDIETLPCTVLEGEEL